MTLAAFLRILPYALLAAFVVYAGYTYRSAQQEARQAREQVALLQWVAKGREAQTASLETQLDTERKAAHARASRLATLTVTLANLQAERDTLFSTPELVEWGRARQPDPVYARRLRRYAALTGAGDNSHEKPADGRPAADRMAAATDR